MQHDSTVTVGRSRPAPGRTQAMVAALGGLVAIVVLSGCNLIGGGGVSQEEYDAAVAEVASANAQLDNALSELSTKAAAAKELETTKAELVKVQQDLATRQAELDTLQQIVDQAQSGVLTLEQARLVVVKYARENRDVYRPDLQRLPLVWQVAKSEEGGDFFYVTLDYRPAGNFAGTPGQEEFILGKKGTVEFRQVLTEPAEAPAGG